MYNLIQGIQRSSVVFIVSSTYLGYRNQVRTLFRALASSHAYSIISGGGSSSRENVTGAVAAD